MALPVLPHTFNFVTFLSVKERGRKINTQGSGQGAGFFFFLVLLFCFCIMITFLNPEMSVIY